jgi:hypothetical protein
MECHISCSGWIKQMKFTIGFKDDEMINGHEVIKRGTIR